MQHSFVQIIRQAEKWKFFDCHMKSVFQAYLLQCKSQKAAFFFKSMAFHFTWHLFTKWSFAVHCNITVGSHSEKN